MKKFVRILALALVAVMLCATLASCGGPNKDPDKALAALKEEGYTAVKVGDYVSGTKLVKDDDGKDKVEHVTIYYYDSKEDATAAMEKIQKLADEEKDDKDTDWVGATQSGSMIYFGTKAAIKAAK